MQTIQQSTVRPYWHADAKWVCGIIFALLFIAILIVNSLRIVTGRDVAVPLATDVLVTLFSRGEGGADSSKDIEEIRRKMSEQGAEKYQPIPGLPAYITQQDLSTMSPRKIREKIFSQIAEKYYDVGVKKLAAEQTSDKEKQEQIVKQAGLLGLVTQTTHGLVSQILTVLLVVAILPLIGLIYFSFGVGRLISPGLILFILALPGTLILSALRFSRSSPGEGGLAALSPEASSLLVRSLLPGFAIPFFIGIGLLMVAGIVGLWRQYHKPAA